jgi:hypothetical protein
MSSSIPNSKAINQIAIQEAQNSTQDPQIAVSQLKTDIDNARNTIKLGYYAPRHLALAEKSLTNANDLLIKQAEPVLILQETIKAQKILEAGKNIKVSVKRHLKSIFDEQEWLDAINAKHYLPDRYNEAITDITGLIDKIENNNIESALDDQNDLFKEMIELEVDVMKTKHLNEAKAFLKKASRIDGNKLAKFTYKKAQNTLDSSAEFIELNSRDIKGIENAGTEALLACKHAFYITEEIIRLTKTDEDEYENYILDIEGLFNRVTVAAKCPDLRHMPLFDQSTELSGFIEAHSKTEPVEKEKTAIAETAFKPEKSEPELPENITQAEATVSPETTDSVEEKAIIETDISENRTNESPVNDEQNSSVAPEVSDDTENNSEISQNSVQSEEATETPSESETAASVSEVKEIIIKSSEAQNEQTEQDAIPNQTEVIIDENTAIDNTTDTEG